MQDTRASMANWRAQPLGPSRATQGHTLVSVLLAFLLPIFAVLLPQAMH